MIHGVRVMDGVASVTARASNDPLVFTITEKAPTNYRAFSLLKAPIIAFTFKTLLRHYVKQARNTMGGYSSFSRGGGDIRNFLCF